MKIKWNELSTEEKNKLISEKVMKGIEANSQSSSGFNPMEDLNDAWQIVMKFGLWYSFKKTFNNSMQVSMGNDLSEGEVVTFCLLVSDGIKRFNYSAEAVTLQEAICLASLNAVGIEVEEEDEE